MESESSEGFTTLGSEISKGMEQVKRLRASSSGDKEKLLERMFATYEEALAILNDVDPEGQNFSLKLPLSVTPGSSERGKRKRSSIETPKWTVQVRVSPDGAVGTTPDDGYSWRKYGQKDILGAKYPRVYYRCTKRNFQGCLATKQVQRSDDDPCVLDVTYRGHHTCKSSGSKELLEKQE